MNRLAVLLAPLVLLAVILVAGTLWFLPESPKQNGTTTQAVKVSMPIDLSGKWESVESKAGTKFVAEVKDNRVFVQMYANDGYTGLWYGTFDILQPGENVMKSKAIEDEDHFVLSTAETKDFLYQKGSLVFDFKVMATVTTIEMKRV